MKYSVTLTLSPDESNDEQLLKQLAVQELSKNNIRISLKDITSLIFKKKSIDARHGRIKLHLRYDIYTNGDTPDSDSANAPFSPKWIQCDSKKRVIIIGSGPAGLFAALKLIEKGITPVIIERGPSTTQRKIDIADISRKGVVNSDSNYCFGEGGAGTFSDGKLYSRSNKRGNISRILQLFNYHGADNSILTDAHPHIGTDKLPSVINNIKDTILKFGGKIHFNTRCTGFITKNGDSTQIVGITTVDTLNGNTSELIGDALILACGHSAPDVYEMIASLNPAALEAKPFAVGVRVEHPREKIDKIQYHGKERGGFLPAAEYRLTTQVDGRGVYSFCMCPGGLVVPSASSPDGIVINGMSPSSRNAKWSNAAIVVEIRPEDFDKTSKDDSTDNNQSQSKSYALAGLKFRNIIENNAKEAAQKTNIENLNPQTAPAQRLVDFLDGRLSTSLPLSSYTPGLASVRLDKLLPSFIVSRLQQAFVDFNMNMHGFICPEALLIAPETRTSTPVRILRDNETMESPVLANLFPAGEGSGYAGGIVSSAMDGEKSADCVIRKLLGE